MIGPGKDLSIKDPVCLSCRRTHLVVVIAFELQVLLESSELRVTDVGTIDEAEEVQHCNGWHDVQVDLAS